MNWYYEQGGQQQGPVSDEALDRLLAEGKILPTTLVWREGMAGWQPLAGARSAPPLPGASGQGLCASCHQSFPAGDLVSIGGKAICPNCKPAVLQSLQQGGSLDDLVVGERSGPPWEHRATLGLWLAAWETIKGVLTEPGGTFRNMRREGGLGSPFLFILLVGSIGLFCNYLFQALFHNLLPQPAHVNPEFDRFFQTIRQGGAAAYGLAIISPIIVTVIAFVNSAILHVCLMICQGARRPFETTFRVVCYANGAGMALYVVPLVGVIGGIWALVAVCIGLARAHEIGTGRAVLAVLLPIIAWCCCAAVGLGILGAALARHH